MYRRTSVLIFTIFRAYCSIIFYKLMFKILKQVLRRTARQILLHILAFRYQSKINLSCRNNQMKSSSILDLGSWDIYTFGFERFPYLVLRDSSGESASSESGVYLKSSVFYFAQQSTNPREKENFKVLKHFQIRSDSGLVSKQMKYENLDAESLKGEF